MSGRVDCGANGNDNVLWPLCGPTASGDLDAVLSQVCSLGKENSILYFTGYMMAGEVK